MKKEELINKLLEKGADPEFHKKLQAFLRITGLSIAAGMAIWAGIHCLLPDNAFADWSGVCCYRNCYHNCYSNCYSNCYLCCYYCDVL